MKKYRLIALDIDGTLLSPESRLTRRTRAAVHSAMRAGYAVTLATGRNWTESRTVLSDLGFAGPCVFVGGAMVVDTGSGETLYCQRMHAELARDLCGVLEDLGHAACALQHTSVAGVDYLISDAAEVSAALTRWLAVTAATYRRLPVGTLPRHGHDHTVRVGVVAPTPEVRRLQALLDERFHERIVRHAIHLPAYGVDVLEAFDPQVSKWRGIMEIAARLGIDPQEVIAIGDDVNDLAMLQHAGLGVAMGNARPGVSEAADLTIASNADDGLAAFLEKLVEGEISGVPAASGT